MMNKNVLVIFYSQTGQLREIIMNIFSHLRIDIDFCEIKTPQYNFPLNWNYMFEMFPESVLQTPCKISYNLPLKEYDTIVIGFQTWFLNISLPIYTFSLTEDFKTLVKGKEVILIMDCRNSWRKSMDYMEKIVIANGGRIKSKHVFASIGGNILGSLAILKWFFTGNKISKYFPEPGVPQSEIDKSKSYGLNIINEYTNDVMFYPSNNNKLMPPEIETSISKKFRWWANFIVKDQNNYRKIKLTLFKVWLAVALIIVSPLFKLFNNKNY